MKPSKYALLSALVVLVVAVAAIIAVVGRHRSAHEEQRSARTTSAPVKVSTRLKWLPGATYAGNFVASRKGFWRRRGLDVKIEPGGFELDSIKLVATGVNDFGVTGADQLLLARAKGVPIVAFAMILQRTPVGWMAKADSGITTPKDFLGRKVGAKYGTNTEILFDALFRKLGLDPGKVKRVPVKFDIMPLLTGQVDVLPVYVNAEPVWAENQGVKVVTILPSDYGVNLYGNVYFTTEKMIKKQPKLVQAFCSGILEGWTWTAEHPEEAAKLLVQANPKLKEAEQLKVLRRTIPFLKLADGTLKVGWMNDEGWRATRDLLAEGGMLPADFDIAPAYTMRFVDLYYKQENDR